MPDEKNPDQGKGARKLSRRAFLRRFTGEGLAQEFAESTVESDAAAEAADRLEAALEALRRVKVSVSRISGDSAKLQVRARDAGRAFTDEQMALLEPLADRIVWLDLGDTGVGDDALPIVAGMTNLRRLYLQNTLVTDAGLEHLSGLKMLTFLNLYGVNVGDAGLEHLHGLEALRSLFLWRTRATPAGIEALTSAIPELKVEQGVT